MTSFMTTLRAKMLAHIDDLPLKEKIVEKKKCIHQAIIFAVVHFDRKASDEKGV